MTSPGLGAEVYYVDASLNPWSAPPVTDAHVRLPKEVLDLAGQFSAFVVVQVIFGIVRLAQGDGLSPIGLIFNGLLAATIGVVGAGIGVWRALRDTSSS